MYNIIIISKQQSKIFFFFFFEYVGQIWTGTRLTLTSVLISFYRFFFANEDYFSYEQLNNNYAALKMVEWTGALPNLFKECIF